jgi:hypothetical protein
MNEIFMDFYIDEFQHHESLKIEIEVGAEKIIEDK